MLATASMPRTLRTTVVAATAALAVSLAAPSFAAAATLPYADAGEYCIEGYKGSTAGTKLGMACFFPHINSLQVHDYARDGHGVHAELVYGKKKASVIDPDGAKSRYGKKTVKVPKGQVPHLRVCVTGLGCTKYKIPHAV